jgi:TRAP-type C4-dicarboxylate transport system permease small subunit
MVKFVDKIYKLLCLNMVVCLGLMTVMVFVNTFLRYTFQISIISSEEWSRFLFVWMIFCGGIVVLSDDIHIKVDLLVVHLPGGVAKYLNVLVNAVLVYVSVILAYGGYIQTVLNMTNYAPATNVPLGYVYSSVVISGVGMALICLTRIVKAFLPAANNKEEAKK